MNKTHIIHLLATDTIKLNLYFESFVSANEKSIPKPGSKTYPLSSLNTKEVFLNLERIISHRNGDFTLVTKAGFIKLYKSSFSDEYRQALIQCKKIALAYQQ